MDVKLSSIPIYMRDLNANVQQDFISSWKNKKRFDLLKAYDRGEDITIGRFFENDGGVVE